MPITPATTVEPSPAQPEANAIAPAWHTGCILLFLLAMVSLTKFWIAGGHSEQAQSRLPGYILTMLMEWLIVAFIAWGPRCRGASLRALAGKIPLGWRSIGRDLWLAAAYLLAANIVLAILGHILKHFGPASDNAALKNLLPHTILENAAFLLLALTAGFCEEMIFRGYLQHQLTAWTRNAAAGIALQGILFGVAHAYQGSIMMIVIVVYGCMFGSLAYWRKSLRPCMIAHFLQDAVGGLVLARFALK
jgi:membrane protease YdiL (CAAX protease family)